MTVIRSAKEAFLPAREIRRSHAMDTRRAEEGSVEYRSLEPIVHLALPRVADAAVGLDGGPRDAQKAVGDVALRVCRRPGRVLTALIPRVGCIPGERTAGLAIEREIGELMLERLEMANRSAELLSLLRVVDRELDTALRPADRIGGQQHERRVAQPRGDCAALR